MSDFAIGSWNQSDPEGKKLTIETTLDNLGNECHRRQKVPKLDVFSKSRQVIRYDSQYKPKNPKAGVERKFWGKTVIINSNKLGISKYILISMTPLSCHSYSHIF